MNYHFSRKAAREIFYKNFYALLRNNILLYIIVTYYNVTNCKPKKTYDFSLKNARILELM